jgi:hypothetical protein
VRTRKGALDELDDILLKQSSDEPEPQRRDSILVATESGDLIVVNWHNGESPTDGGLVFKPGLRHRNMWPIASPPGSTSTSLGKFIKVSEE